MGPGPRPRPEVSEKAGQRSSASARVSDHVTDIRLNSTVIFMEESGSRRRSRGNSATSRREVKQSLPSCRLDRSFPRVYRHSPSCRFHPLQPVRPPRVFNLFTSSCSRFIALNLNGTVGRFQEDVGTVSPAARGVSSSESPCVSSISVPPDGFTAGKKNVDHVHQNPCTSGTNGRFSDAV